jgi:hypothetical protein
MPTMRFAILMLALALPAGAALAQSATGGRLDNAERRLDAIDPRPAGTTVAQASDDQRLDAIERRLDALERRLGSAQQAPPSQQAPATVAAQPPAAASVPQAPAAAVQLPGGAVQQVPATTAAAATAAPSPAPVQATYRSLGMHKGMTEEEVIKLLGPPVKTVRGYVDVMFYSKDNTEPNVNIQYGHVIGWHD